MSLFPSYMVSDFVGRIGWFSWMLKWRNCKNSPLSRMDSFPRRSWFCQSWCFWGGRMGSLGFTSWKSSWICALSRTCYHSNAGKHFKIIFTLKSLLKLFKEHISVGSFKAQKLWENKDFTPVACPGIFTWYSQVRKIYPKMCINLNDFPHWVFFNVRKTHANSRGIFFVLANITVKIPRHGTGG